MLATQTLKDPDSYMPGEAALAEIETHIAAYNRARPEIYNRCMTWALIGLAVYACFAALVILYAWELDARGKSFGVVLGLLFLGGAGLWTLMWRPMEKHQEALRMQLFPRLFGFIDGVTYAKGGKPALLNQVAELKLVRYGNAENDDLIAGRHEGMDFELLETRLTVGSGRSKETVFRGLIFHFRLDRAFPGMLVAAKRGGWWQRTMKEFWRTGPKTELTSGNLRLDESHEFHSDNFAAARPVIAGSLTSVLTWLGNEWHGGDVQIALSGEDGYLMLPSNHDYFSLPGNTEDVVYQRHVRPLVRELVIALAVAHVVRHVN